MKGKQSVALWHDKGETIGGDINWRGMEERNMGGSMGKEHYRPSKKPCRKVLLYMSPKINTYIWKEVFKYNGGYNIPAICLMPPIKAPLP